MANRFRFREGHRPPGMNGSHGRLLGHMHCATSDASFTMHNIAVAMYILLLRASTASVHLAVFYHHPGADYIALVPVRFTLFSAVSVSTMLWHLLLKYLPYFCTVSACLISFLAGSVYTMLWHLLLQFLLYFFKVVTRCKRYRDKKCTCPCVYTFIVPQLSKQYSS